MYKTFAAASLSLALTFPAVAQHKAMVECPPDGEVVKCINRAHTAARSEGKSIVTILRHKGGDVSSTLLVHPNGKFDTLNVKETLEKYGIRPSLK